MAAVQTLNKLKLSKFHVGFNYIYTTQLILTKMTN